VGSTLARRRLIAHPATPCRAIDDIHVMVARPHANEIRLDYVVNGRIPELRVPRMAEPARSDGLWKHMCFELFAGAADDYREFNFAPSRRWAAYGFSGYREGMRSVEMAAPHIVLDVTANCLMLTAVLDAAVVPAGPAGLSAVIEDADGNLSYWALAHPPEMPDFHHRDCFALKLPAPPRA
jgi:hypothetical protein